MAEYLHDHPIVPRTDEEKQAVINRLKRIEGQIRGLQKMVDEDRYCVDILVQIRAVQAALKKVEYTVAEHHMKHCVLAAAQTGEGDAAVNELIQIMKQFSK